MLGDETVPNSDAWWLTRLWRKLEKRQARLERLNLYFEGRPPLPEGINDFIAARYYDFLATSRTNFAELVAEAPRERMQLIGVRTDTSQGESGDAEAWNMYRAAGLPVSSADVHQNMLALGDGYVIVGEDAATAEDPRQVVTIHDPLQQRKVLAGAKFFYDPERQRAYAYLFLPGRVRKALVDRKGAGAGTLRMSFSAKVWQWADELPDTDSDYQAPESVTLPPQLADRVCLVRFRNRRGISEFETHTDLLDRINRMMLRRVVIATYQAFRQRAAMGEFPERDEQGNEIEWDKLLEAGPDAMWLLPPDTKMWESGQVDLTGILESIKADVLFLAAVTRTPLSMITPDAAAQAAEGAALQREGLVFKTEDRIARAGAGWSDVWELMYLWRGDASHASGSIEPLWAPVERYSLAEKGSAWAQFNGLPFATRVRTVLQVGPDELARIQTERQDDLVAAQVALAAQQALAPAPVAPAQPVAPPAG